MIDVAALRAETPGVDHVVHLNNAGASLMATPTVDAIHAYLEVEMQIGGYEALERHAAQAEEVYGALATLIGAQPDEVALSDSATGAWNMILAGLDLGDGDRIITTTTEYGSNWAVYLRLEERFGVESVVVGDAPSGEIDVEALDQELRRGAALVSINHIPTNGGVVNPAEEIGRVAKNHGVPFLLDACQSVGQLPIDVGRIGCDFLTGTSRKYLRGPRGIGFGYVARESLDSVRPVFVDNVAASVGLDSVTMRQDARRIQWFEHPWANVMGMGVAIRSAQRIGIEAIWERIQHLADRARQELAAVPGVTIRDRGSVQSGLVTFTVDGLAAPEVRGRLSDQSINISHSTVNSAPYDMTTRGLESVCRASVHAFNTEEEVERLVTAVATLTS